MRHVAHFAINADDVTRARQFYTAAFGWGFSPWGPPDFYQITGMEGGPIGALQGRRELVAGKPMWGYECSISVAVIEKTEAAIKKAGGRIVMPRFAIPTVGTGLFFEDTEGNLAGAMQYEKK